MALYFGTFNPLHTGHAAILRHLLQSGFDQVRLVVSPQSPFKMEAVKSAEERLENVREAVKRAGLDVEVSDVEFSLPKPNYTVNTLRWLKEQEPDTEFTIAMGADNIVDIEKWHQWRELVDGCSIWVYPRRGYDVEELCGRLGGNIKLVDVPMVDISSTEIREGKAKKEYII